MTVVHLVRHGEKAGGPGDPGLSAAGEAEAGLTADLLAGRPIGAVVSSPLRRARETAAVIAARHHLDVVVDDRLRERINWGDGGQQTWDEFAAMWDRATAERDWQPPYGDSSRAAGDRLEAAVDEVAADHDHSGDEREVVLVAHGGIISDLLRNLFPEKELDAANADWADMGTCAVTRIRRRASDSRWELESLTSCEHLRR